VFNFLNVALLYLFLGAPFIAITQVTVYAGAIMVLFLFVIMLLGTEYLSREEPLKRQRFFALILACLFILEMIVVFNQHSGVSGGEIFAVTFVTPAEIGLALFTDYALPLEMTAMVLLAAVIGAILFTHKEKQQRQLEAVDTPENQQDAVPDFHEEKL
jgi:NADH-quinone oxidoreductase subunit J